MLIKLTLAAAALVSIAGCANFGREDASVFSASPTSVTMRFEEGELADATGRAEALCGNHGRAARLQRVSPSGDYRIANFDCVSRT